LRGAGNGAPRWVERNFGDALDWAEQTHGDREAVVCGDVRLSFAQMAARVRAFARGLIELGVAPGEKVALWMSDRPEWLVARWAVPMIGAVLVPVNTRFREKDVHYVLAQSDCTTLIVEEGARGVRYFDILGQLVPTWREAERGAWRSEAFPALRQVVGLAGGAGGRVPASMEGFDEIEALGALLLH
jgi:fatty-acyl-CoA synthase